MPETAAGLAVVLSTLPDKAQATALARQLVDERLIACGSVVPGLTSIYRWEGSVEESSEVLLVMKTRSELVPALCDRVAALHPYEVPEVLAMGVTEVATAYGQWVRHETTEVNG